MGRYGYMSKFCKKSIKKRNGNGLSDQESKKSKRSQRLDTFGMDGCFMVQERYSLTLTLRRFKKDVRYQSSGKYSKHVREISLGYLYNALDRDEHAAMNLLSQLVQVIGGWSRLPPFQYRLTRSEKVDRNACNLREK
ncbi:hypothetical protein Tco_0289780 [Tanacetum coccineum]